MKPISLVDMKENKKYGVKSLMKDMERIHDQDDIEVMAIVYKTKDGTVSIGTTESLNSEVIGLLEIGKIQIIDDM